MPKRPVRLPQRTTSKLVIDGQIVPLRLRLDRRARRYIVRVDPFTGEVAVTSPSKRGTETALLFAREQADWIAEKLAALPPVRAFSDGSLIPFRGEDHLIRHCPQARGVVWIEKAAAVSQTPVLCVAGEEVFLARRLEDWLKRRARKEIAARLATHAHRLDLAPPRFGLRDPRSRWGSCTSEGRMSFSWRLILAPDFVLDYVVAHEVAHLKEMNHSPAFWSLAQSLSAHVEEAENWLKFKGALLHRVGA
jgi:predicted metal-dependent hydrolase